MIRIRKALSFNDVLLEPGYSGILPKDINIKSRFSRNVEVNIPISSAAMDSVTEWGLARALSREGGIGIIHKNLTPKRQAYELKRTKLGMSGIIDDPITISPNTTIKELHEKSRKFEFDVFPVTNGKKTIYAMMSTKNVYFENPESKESIKKYMVPLEKVKRIYKEDVFVDGKFEINKAYKHFKNIHSKHLKSVLPIIGKEDGKFYGIVTARDLKDIFLNTYPNLNVDKDHHLKVGAAVSPSKDVDERLEKLVEAGVDVIVIDTAHGESKNVGNLLKRIKRNYSYVDVVAGNVATKRGAKYLADLGADGVKVGMGPGSICTTRVVTGVGGPQITAINDCVDAILAGNYDIPIIGDGGIEYPGDITKAMGAGADCVMIGSKLAAVDESPGEIFFIDGVAYKPTRGMGSIGAMKKGSADRYKQGYAKEKELVPEGIEGRVEYIGTLQDFIIQYIGGLRAGMGYIGAKNIEELHEKANFLEISASAAKENHPHGVKMDKAAPNYRQ